MKKGGAGDAGGGREYFGRKLLWRKTRDFGLEVHLCCWKKQGKIRYRYCYGGVIILGIKESGKRRIKLLLQIQAMSEPVKNRCVWAENLIHEINLS